jgi:hypothetical protein
LVNFDFKLLDLIKILLKNRQAELLKVIQSKDADFDSYKNSEFDLKNELLSTKQALEKKESESLAAKVRLL